MRIPIASIADRWVRDLASSTGSAKLERIDGQTLLGERAMFSSLPVPGLRSAGGGCRLYPAKDGTVALTLAREDDHMLLPALLRRDTIDPADEDALAAAIAMENAVDLVEHGRMLGLAIAAETEARPSPRTIAMVRSSVSAPRPSRMPRILDLSALWAGPLCTHLLVLAGAQAVKVENASRPDAMRGGRDARLFALLNGCKRQHRLDFAHADDRKVLDAILDDSDIVIAAARPRALHQLGFDPAAFVQKRPGRVWMTITGHGDEGEAGNWIGLGDDCAVAGGACHALREATGRPGFLGDAIADPLSGLYAARALWAAWSSGRGGVMTLAMRGVIGEALAEAGRDAASLANELRIWRDSEGLPFPPVVARDQHADLHCLFAPC